MTTLALPALRGEAGLPHTASLLLTSHTITLQEKKALKQLRFLTLLGSQLLKNKSKTKPIVLQSVPTRTHNRSNFVEILPKKKLITKVWNCSLHPLLLKQGYVDFSDSFCGARLKSYRITEQLGLE